MTARALGGVVQIEGDVHLRALVVALSAAKNAYRLDGRSSGPQFDDIVAAASQAMSANGLTDVRTTPVPAVSLTDPIGVDEAANILGCSTRHIRRIATTLDGRKVSRHWSFERHTVLDYRDRERECQTSTPPKSRNT